MGSEELLVSSIFVLLLLLLMLRLLFILNIHYVSTQ
jgi:hypothetical protein